MDTKGGRQSETEKRGRQHNNAKASRYDQVQRSFSKCMKFLKTHKQSLLAAILLTFLVVLLFAFFSQLQAPAANTPPSGVTAVDYSTFVGQVKAGNVLAVTMQGQELNGLLISPLGHRAGAASILTITPSQRAADLAAWNRSNGPISSSWSVTTTSPTFDAARVLYTRSPGSGDS